MKIVIVQLTGPPTGYLTCIECGGHIYAGRNYPECACGWPNNCAEDPLPPQDRCPCCDGEAVILDKPEGDNLIACRGGCQWVGEAGIPHGPCETSPCYMGEHL